MFDIITHRLFIGTYSVCVHHDSVFCVCTLCFFSPHTFGELYIWRAIYIHVEGHIYLAAYICLEGSSLV
jgi:hypothetical protein